ncbi:MAG: ribosome maturation factor RimP [Candidatus Omnitrophica bacterium]|nr:ribosome maturation factor RimP [Candidatus Omnitrophota bacterium]
MEILERVQELLTPYLSEHGIELVEITYKRMQEGMTLRLLVDTPAGVRMDECEALNNFLSETLDRENVIEEHYLIEVSSPGLDRPMKTDRDFERNLGKDIEVTTYEAIDGRKTHEGRFVGMNKEEIVMERGGVSVVIPRNKIALARQKLEF